LMDDAASGGTSSRRRSFARCLGRVKPIETVPFATVFPRCDCYSVDDLPRHGIIRAEPVRLPVPPLLGHLGHEGGIEEDREDMVVACPPIPCEVGRPDDHDQVRMFALAT